MPADRLDDPAAALRSAAAAPRAPVDPDAVIARGAALRRQRVAVRMVLALALAIPAATGILTLTGGSAVDMADRPDTGVVPATLAAQEEAPTTLVDGTPVETAPEAVRRRFTRPVVAAARPATVPDYLAAPCDRVRSLGGADSDRLTRLRDDARAEVVHVGPHAVTSLAVGSAPAPPAYPDAFAVACMGVPAGSDGLAAPGAVVTHLYRGWTGYLTPQDPGEDGRAWWMSALPVPRGAAWAVQEEPGWWLAYDVTGADWMLAQAGRAAGAAEDVAFPGARVVFLDAAGDLLGEERLGREAINEEAPFLQRQPAPARIRFPDEAALRTELAAGPVPACAEEVTACVWVADVAGRIVALSAAGPVPDEVPPLGQVGWCPSSGRFEGEGGASAYAPDGTWLAGPSRTGLHGYGVRLEDGGVVVDLARFHFGPTRPADGGEARGDGACDDLEEPGFPMP